MVSAENCYSRRVIADVITAKRSAVRADTLTRQVEAEHGRHIMGFPQSSILDLADSSTHSTQRMALQDIIAARHVYGERLLNRIPKSAVKVYDQYLQAKDDIHSLSSALADGIPQGDIDLASDSVQTFLLQGAKFTNFYQDAENALKKLGRKLFVASLTARGTELQRRNKAYEPINFYDYVAVIRLDLAQDHKIAEDEAAPMTSEHAMQFVEQLAKQCGISPEKADNATICTFMNTIGFFTQLTNEGKEIWYREATPASWLYDLWMKKQAAMETFSQAREEGDTPRAYFALARVQELEDEADSIRSGIVEELKGQRAHYPGKYLRQIGTRMYRVHKVLRFPLDEEKA